jgi:hypothetical protein
MSDGEAVDGAAATVARHLGTTREEVLESWRSSGQRRRWIDWGFFITD